MVDTSKNGYWGHQQHTIPYDITSRILAGFRLVTTTTRRFCIFSTGTNFTKPLTTCKPDEGLMVFTIWSVANARLFLVRQEDSGNMPI